MPEPVRFDDIRIAVFIPAGTSDTAADAARETLDDPAFLDTFLNTIRQLFATVPALAVLSISLES